MILVDSNVLIDVLEDDPIWRDWSFARLEDASEAGQVAIDPIVVAEVGPRFGELAVFKDRLVALGMIMLSLDEAAAFTAGQIFQRYKARRPAAQTILADFLIGAQASTLGAMLLTRDPRFYRRYFPDLPLITPETHPNG